MLLVKVDKLKKTIDTYLMEKEQEAEGFLWVIKAIKGWNSKNAEAELFDLRVNKIKAQTM